MVGSVEMVTYSLGKSCFAASISEPNIKSTLRYGRPDRPAQNERIAGRVGRNLLDMGVHKYGICCALVQMSAGGIMVRSEAIGRTVRRGPQIVVIDAGAAEAWDRPRVFFEEKEHARCIHDHMFFVYSVKPSFFVLIGHVIHAIPIKVGIHTIAVLRFDGNGRAVTIPATYHFPIFN